MALRSAAEGFSASAKFLSIINRAMSFSRLVREQQDPIVCLKVHAGWRSRTFTRQHQKNVRCRTPLSEHMRSLDFASHEVIRKGHSTVRRIQQGIDIDNQARHFQSPRKLRGLAQVLKAQLLLGVRLPCYQEGAVPV